MTAKITPCLPPVSAAGVVAVGIGRGVADGSGVRVKVGIWVGAVVAEG